MDRIAKILDSALSHTSNKYRLKPALTFNLHANFFPTGFFPGSFQSCSQFLRHKMTIISPQVLRKFSIPYDKVS